MGVTVLTAWACLGLGARGGEVIVREEFAGWAAVSRRTDVGALPAILALKESGRLLDDVTRKLGAAFPRWFGATHATGTNHAVAFQAVIRSILNAPSRIEVQAEGGRVSSWAVAARLSGVEAEGLGMELARQMPALLFGANPPTFKLGAEWEMKGPEGKGSVRWARREGWVLLGSGSGSMESLSARVEGAGGDPKEGQILGLELDLGRIAKLLEWRAEPPGMVPQWPSVALTVEPRNGRLRTQAQLKYAAPLGLKLEEWVLPDDVVRDPLVGFTAVQGADRWLGRLGFLADLGVKEWPRQLFLWSMAGPPWLQFLSAPIERATNLMTQVATTLPVGFVTNTMWQGQAFALRVTNQATRVELLGLPYFQPYLEARRQNGRETVHGGLFPVSFRRLPPMDGLLGQVRGRTNLVAYDWETTGRAVVITNRRAEATGVLETNVIGRLPQFRELYQFGMLMMNKAGGELPADETGRIRTPGGAWVDAAGALLGDTITEVTWTGPSQLSLVRNSQVGFNAFELTYLLRWLSNAGFPGWIEPPPLARRAPPDGKKAPAPPSP